MNEQPVPSHPYNAMRYHASSSIKPLLAVLCLSRNSFAFLSLRVTIPQVTHTFHQGTQTELDNEEPLSVMFQRAVVLQRAGSHSEALDEYSMFLKAAAQCNVDPTMYAEVYGNMGALYLRQQDFQKARDHLYEALKYRPKFGTAHVNLAVVALQEASSEKDPEQARTSIDNARQFCRTALNCNTDPRSVAMASRLLNDIEDMINPPLQ